MSTPLNKLSAAFLKRQQITGRNTYKEFSQKALEILKRFENIPEIKEVLETEANNTESDTWLLQQTDHS